MPDDEKRRCVNKLLAQWHLDKNRHRVALSKCVFQFIQDEVNVILTAREVPRTATSFQSKAEEEAEEEAERPYLMA
eukprot:4096062-Heterocapsa_arctica.AAC.1